MVATSEHKGLRKRLKELPADYLAVLVLRVSLRLLPRLAMARSDGRGEVGVESGFLWYWPEEERERHLVSVVRAQQVTMGGGLEKADLRAAANAAANAVNTAVNTADAAFAAFAAFVAYAAANAAAYAADDDATNANAADAAAYATNVAIANAALSDELILMESFTDVEAYLQHPIIPLPGEEGLAAIFVDQLRTMGNGFDYWADWYEERLAGIAPDLALLRESVELPRELLEKSPAEINAYLKAIRDRRVTAPLNRVRALFVGHGESGKTSLIRTLHDEPVVAGKEAMTPGIEIREWPLPGTEIRAHLWDFGGQVMAHATHQFFLRERCLYVVVLNARAEVNGNEQAEYWLEHVRAFGGEAPVLLVANKADLASLLLDMNHLKEKHPNIVGLYPLCCTDLEKYAPQMAIFREAFEEQLVKVGTHQLLFAPSHFKVLEALRERSPKASFLERSEFESLCAEYKVDDEGELGREWLLNLLDKLGVIIHFPDIPSLDAYVLNPRWLTYGVYTLLYAERAREQRGRLSEKDVVEILQSERVEDDRGNVLDYPPEKCRFILDAMEQFKLCYRVPGDGREWIVPDLLPSDRPAELFFNKNDALSFVFDFQGLLPRHLISNFIVQRHGEIVDGVVWQNGVRIDSGALEASAVVQADYHARELALWVSGAEANRYFQVLYDEIKQMLGRMPKLRYREWVVLAGNDEEARAPYRQLLAMERAGQEHYISEYGTFPLAVVLKIMPKEARVRQARGDVHNHFHGDRVIYSEGDLSDVTFGDKRVTVVRECDERLGRLAYALDLEGEERALKELSMVRRALATAEKGAPEERVEAVDRILRFGERIKTGLGEGWAAVKGAKENVEALEWLAENIPKVVTALGGLA